MKYFKNKKNQVFAYDDEQIEKGYGKDLVPITEEEMLAITNPEKTKEEIENERVQNILSQIEILESKTYRPLREHLVGTEEEKLQASIILGNLDEQIKSLRSQL